MSKWTPGPWYISQDSQTEVRALGLGTIATVDQNFGIANAILIKEAPEMAELLRRLVASADDSANIKDAINELVLIADSARALLARLEADK